MKKIVSFIAMMFLLSSGFCAAKTNSNLNNLPPDQPTKLSVNTNSTTVMFLTEQELSVVICTSFVSSVTPVGVDMNGNTIYQVTVTTICMSFPNNPGGA